MVNDPAFKRTSKWAQREVADQHPKQRPLGNTDLRKSGNSSSHCDLIAVLDLGLEGSLKEPGEFVVRDVRLEKLDDLAPWDARKEVLHVRRGQGTGQARG